MLPNFKTKLQHAGAMCALALSLALPGSAQAVFYAGAWDPAFGPAFPGLGWRGEATFFVPDACLSIEGTVTVGDTCTTGPGGGLKIVSAEMEFYNLAAPATTLETLYFSTPSTLVFSVNLSGGELSAVVGAFGYILPTSLTLAGAPTTSFGLGFVGELAISCFYDRSKEPRSFSIGLPGGSIGCSDLEASDGSAPFLKFTRVSAVPEPSVLLLLAGAALGLAGAARRRRH
jgi:hypothetical protein